MIFFIILGLLPSFIWMSFFLQEDIHPEPRRIIFLTFLFGMVSAFFALAGQKLLSDTFLNMGVSKTDFWPIAGYAGIEEVAKFLAAYFVVMKSKYFDEPIDAMIYIMCAAMGLAAIENVFLMIGSDDATVDKVGLILFRFLGATLLHALSSSLAGYYWAKGLVRNRMIFYVPFGIFAATILHAFFNYFVLRFDGKLVYTLALLIFASFFIFYDFEKLQRSGEIASSYELRT